MEKPKARLIKTNDGTPTIYFEDFNEAMHTSDGAYSESLIKHITPSGLVSSSKGTLRILDVGFGMGYNILALLHELEQREKKPSLEIVSFEWEPWYGHLLREVNFGDDRDRLYDLVCTAFEEGSASKENVAIQVLSGDGRDNVKELTGSFDAVFQDPFSPAKNPELWTLEFFRNLYDLMDDEARLTTYSSAPQVRGAMVEAGFFIQRAPSMGIKREGTIATKKENSSSFDAAFINELRENVKSTPYRDENGNKNREDILQERIEEMARKRAERKEIS